VKETIVLENHAQFCRCVSVLFFLCATNLSLAQTQSRTEQQPSNSPTVILPAEKAPAPVARETERLCGGFIEYAPPQNQLEVVGGEQEQEQNLYAVGDYVFINTGAQQGVSEGQEFSVVRPRGEFSSKFSGKRGTLGIYTQEVGRLRVTEVKAQVSVAVISASCQAVLLGDLLRPVPSRPSSISRVEEELNRFAEPSGKQTGRIVLARDAREVVSKNQIVFIDLGTEDNIKAGDYLTVYRPVGTPNVARIPNEEIARNASSGFESEHFRGGKFSIQAQRVKDPTDARRINPPVTSPEVKGRRPPLPRKVVGEVVVLNVQQRTATVMITRTAQEIHTGDFVELQ